MCELLQSRKTSEDCTWAMMSRSVIKLGRSVLSAVGVGQNVNHLHRISTIPVHLRYSDQMADKGSESGDGGFSPFPHFSTLAIHAGQEPEQWSSRAVVPPISLATTFKQEAPGKHAVLFSVSLTYCCKFPCFVFRVYSSLVQWLKCPLLCQRTFFSQKPYSVFHIAFCEDG